MRIIRTIDELMIKIAHSKSRIIYGAGWSGKLICKFLKRKGVIITAFAVTIQNKEYVQEGISVIHLDSVLEQIQLKDTVIILAATPSNRYTMEKELEKRGISGYVEIPDILLYEISKENQKTEAIEAENAKKKIKYCQTVGFLSPGYFDTDYAEKRLIINKIETAHYVALPKETADVKNISIRQDANLETYRMLSEACYCPDRYAPDVEFIHTFNTVCDTDKLWCASFETVMPRIWDESEGERQYYLRLVNLMKQPNCKALFALCRNAYDMQKNSLMTYVSQEDVKLLMEKTKVLHPPQEILITEDEFDKKHNLENIHFIFIGRAFFIKGGREILQVLSEFEERYRFQLTLISSLQYTDYFTKTSYEEMIRYKEIIKSKKWIDYYESLPNTEVIDKCKEATIGLFPSVADTYGYAVLEMQAAGCPVVTTNIRALSEINNEECGWVCNIPVDSSGCCTEQDRRVWSEILQNELKRCLQDIFDNPELIRQKGRKALECIQKMHSPYEYQRELLKNLEKNDDKNISCDTCI